MKRALAKGLALAFLIGSVGCVQHHHHTSTTTARTGVRSMPPSHAPAHGRRRQQPEVDLILDRTLGVYVVVGQRFHYFDGHHYFRVVEGAWQTSRHIDRGWLALSVWDVPDPVRAKHRKKKAQRARGQVPARNAR